jgi:NADH:ubiquinone reductase (H+-translocating)
MTVKTEIVILGGGFAGVETARYLDRTAAKRADVEVTLVSRDNFILFTPMLDEVVAGDLEPVHICNPLRNASACNGFERGNQSDRPCGSAGDDLLRHYSAYPRVAV